MKITIRTGVNEFTGTSQEVRDYMASNSGPHYLVKMERRMEVYHEDTAAKQLEISCEGHFVLHMPQDYFLPVGTIRALWEES
jgi:hypothetical protein